MSAAHTAFVGLGANLGDAAAALRAACTSLDALPGTRVQRTSRLYLTPAWGLTDQPDFFNAVAMVETVLSPQLLLAAMLEIERDAGRERRADGSDRWGPRTLDLDLLLYDDLVLDVAGLHVPHPRLHERAFALMPLVEIAPQVCIPGHGAAVDLLGAMETGDIQALG